MVLVRSRKFFVVGALLLLSAGAIGVFTFVRKPRLTPALRGYEVAQSFGCFACHGPGGTGGIPNPGSDEEQVPAWDGGNAMMYVENEQEIREWILYGHPRRLQHEHEAPPPGDPESGGDSGHGDNAPSALPLRMPAFENVMSASQLDDLVAYYKAVAAFETPPPKAREGYRVASRLGCFGCHGPGGQVGSANPRSFKGYIPPWQGADYAELVKDRDELRDWILDGKIGRFESNPLARRFTKRQVIQMPAYRDVLQDSELEALMAYVEWLNRKL